MKSKRPETGALKQNVTHELAELVGVFLYLAIFFCAISTYSMLLLNGFHVEYFSYGAALVTALVLSKVVLLGEAAGLGKKYESKPLIFSTVYKAFLFSVLVAIFHVVEEVLKRYFHGQELRGATYEMWTLHRDEVLARNLVVFCGFLPFFAFMELRRVMGEERFFRLFFRGGAMALSDFPGKLPDV